MALHSLYLGKKVGVSKEEQALPYYNLFTREMTPAPAEKMALIDQPSAKEAVPFAQRSLFLLGQDKDYCQVGYGVMSDGTGFVCNETYMPDVTSEMMDWWFPWHSVGSDLRYKIWDPEDHYFARADNAAYVCDPNVPVREKTWNVNHYVIEDVGMGPSFLKLQFRRPRDFGYDESVLKNGKSMVCAIGAGECAAAMTHLWEPAKDGGIIFRSRFWIGYALQADGSIVNGLPQGAKVPMAAAKGLFSHNIKEFTNLASVLPKVYEQNKDNF